MDTQITRAEAETLAVMLDSAGRKMARVRDRKPGTDDYTYVWDVTGEDSPWAEMLQGFYDIVPFEYGIYV